jgi:carbamoyl-phosphate synthase large subunit
MAGELGVIGLMNVQYAVKDDDLYILEVNPRASRTVPFVSKATGVPLAKLATKVMMGMSLEQLGLTSEVKIKHWAVKEAVFPFDRFKNVDTLLGPEMKSTGEVMGVDANLGLALAKAQLAAGTTLPTSGTVFLSLRGDDKEGLLEAARNLVEMKFSLLATEGTADYFKQHGVPCDQVNKISEGRPHILDKLRDRQVDWVVNTSMGRRTTEDSYLIRRAALELRIPYTTTISGAVSVVMAIQALRVSDMEVQPIQYFT